MPTNDSFQGVSNCYVFKSRLQEYAQKVGMSTPVYDTVKEGPSHEPYFRSSVVVNKVRFDSLPKFFNRKAAEQSAAEVALLELAKSGSIDQCISQPIYETGLCKNLLQEYAQKMNYAIPLYQCQQKKGQGQSTPFQCTVEIGGIRYIGAAARTKKEAELKAARTALLAIESLASKSVDPKPIQTTQLTVLPCKKRPVDLLIKDTPAPPKVRRRGRGKKKLSNTAFAGMRKKKSAKAHVEIPIKSEQDREMPAVGWMPEASEGEFGSSLIPQVNDQNGDIPQVSCGDMGPVAKNVKGVSDVRDMNVKLNISSSAMDIELEEWFLC